MGGLFLTGTGLSWKQLGSPRSRSSINKGADDFSLKRMRQTRTAYVGNVSYASQQKITTFTLPICVPVPCGQFRYFARASPHATEVN